MDEERLRTLRGEIDRIDGELVSLIRRRVEAARRVGEAKGGAPVYDPVREERVLRGVLERAEGVPPGALRAIYREILSLCRGVQGPLRAVCLGPGGSYSEEALRAALGEAPEVCFEATLGEVFRVLGNGGADLGVVPIENSLEGTVTATLDAFSAAPEALRIRSEVSLAIRHMLASRASDLKDLREVRSHPQGLAQCRQWLAANLPGVVLRASESTSAAAEEAARDPSTAAICSRAAAERNGLPILVADVQDRADNRTRFWIVGPEPLPSPSEPEGGGKTSILFNVRHEPGALFYALEPLYRAGLNLMVIQSRPLPGNPFEYLFFVDFEGSAEEDPGAEVIRVMRPRCTFLRVLGSYPCRAG